MPRLGPAVHTPPATRREGIRARGCCCCCLGRSGGAAGCRGGAAAAKDDEEHEAAAPSLLALPGGVGAFELLREAADEAELEAGPESLPEAPPTHCKP